MTGALGSWTGNSAANQSSSPFGALSGTPRPTGALYSTASAMPTSPQPSFGGPMDVSGIASQPLVETKLPQAPPRRTGAFDDQHRSQTMLQMAAGFFGSQNFGDGLANAARAIHQGNEDAWNSGKPVIGGPDNAFEIYTNEDGTHRYEPIKAVFDYNEAEAAREAALRKKGPVAKDQMDMFGRLAAVVSQYPATQQAQAWTEGRSYLASLGVEGLPETYNPAFREYGAPVPVMTNAATGQKRAAEQARHNGIMEGQGATRVGLAINADRRAGQKKQPPTAVFNGYEIRRDPTTGKIMRRKVQ